MENSGFLAIDPKPSDFLSSGLTGIVPETRLVTGDWLPFLPDDEAQSGHIFDTMACVTFSAINVVETQVNFIIAAGQMPTEAFAELKNLGLVKNGKMNCSDRFTAKMSGTTKQGNYLVSVWDSIRKHGLLPEMDWPWDRNGAFDWDMYYSDIPQALKDKAKRVLDVLDITYEWLTADRSQAQFSEWLKMAPIQIATPVCPPWSTTELITGCNLAVGHATMMFHAGQSSYSILDHYIPFKKHLSIDYPIPYAMRGVVSVKRKHYMPIDPTYGKKFSGKLLLAVEDKGALWYVTPEGKRAKIGSSMEDFSAFIEAINLKKVPVTGITNNDLSKIVKV